MKPELKVEVIVGFLVDHAVDIILMVFDEIDLLAFACELVEVFFRSVEVSKVFFHVVSNGRGERVETSACFARAYRNPYRFMYVV